jgi:hypothetical protein
MTGASRRLLMVWLTSAALAVPAAGQEPGPPPAPPAGPGAPALTAPPETAAPAQQQADAISDGLNLLFLIACMAAGVVAVIVAFRVYTHVRLDNPIISAVNDPWVQAKLREQPVGPEDESGGPDAGPGDRG